MKFSSGISDSVQLVKAATEAAEQAAAQLGGTRPHIALLFASPIYRSQWPDALSRVQEILRAGVLLGCSGSGVIGGDQELEWVPAVSVIAAHVPEGRLLPFSVRPHELEASSPGRFWIEKIGATPQDHPVFILLIDPHTCDEAKLLSELNATFPRCPVIGGLVSGGQEAGEHLLMYDTELVRNGAVGVAMTGNLQLETVIAQGCRPIGRPFVITKADDNIVWELGGRQTLEILREVLMGLNHEDQELAQRSIFVGLVINEMQSTFRSGDFLIRNLAGIDPPSGAIAVAESVQVGQTLQFHLRDPMASQQEFRRLLLARSQERVHGSPAGALVFNCLGRGKSFYGTAHQDLNTIRSVFGKQLPVGGFFCNGEIGPVGGVNFVHGYTASVGLFSPAPVTAPVTVVSSMKG